MNIPLCLLSVALTIAAVNATVTIDHDRLHFDRRAQPAMLSTEVQYFRLRGGYEKNIPRARVLAQWNLVLDQARAAGAEMITTYIPWDFHEYKSGRFDFDGTVDEDHDGRPDYPARDLNTFFKLVRQKGFRAALVRPGPYISSEWGFLAIGAVPRWFYEKYPDLRTQTAEGLPNRFLDTMDPRFLKATRAWFAALYRHVLRAQVHQHKLVRFVQLDNETNYMWQPLSRADHGPANVKRFNAYLKTRNLPNVATAPVDQWSDPKTSGWFYDFMEQQLRGYLASLRQMWEQIGLREPNIMFTLGESFDAPHPEPTRGIEGLLPHYLHRNEAGLMTLNVYPLGGETNYDQLIEHPFKIDHNAKAAASATSTHLKSAQDYLMSTEIEGCNMWPKPRHPEQAMKQIYLSALGRGLKVLNLFYFHHGYNFQNEWFRERFKRVFQDLKSEPKWKAVAEADLPDAFWERLQKEVDEKIAVGFWALKETWRGEIPLFTETNLANNLCFTADYRPKPYFHDVIAHLGNDVIKKNGEFLGQSRDMADPVCLVHDSGAHRPPATGTIDAVTANADWEPALFGLISEMGFNPRVVHADLTRPDPLADCKLILFEDLNTENPAFEKRLRDFVAAGGRAVSFLGLRKAEGLGFKIKASEPGVGDVLGDPELPATQTYLPEDSRCRGILNSMPGFAGLDCGLGRGHFLQISPPIFKQFSSGYFSHLNNIPALAEFWRTQIWPDGPAPRVELVPHPEKVIAWGRRRPDAEDYWLTVRSARLSEESLSVRVREARLVGTYRVTDVWSGESFTIPGAELAEIGMPLTLGKFETRAFRVRLEP